MPHLLSYRWPMLVLSALAVALVAGPARTPVHADTTNVSVIACENIAPYLDGDGGDATTQADLDLACKQPLPPTGPLSIAALESAVGTPDGQLLFEDLIPLDALDNNRIPADCTYTDVITSGTKAADSCTLLIFVFVDDESPVTLDVPSTLASIETGSDAVCSSEGSGFSQDNDCVDDFPNPPDGDGVVVFHALNNTAIDGQSSFVNVVQEAVGQSAQVSISPLSRYDLDGFDDGDGVPASGDNCPFSYNPDQLNTDDTPIVTPGVVPLDTSIPMSDELGDECDFDDDNDGLTDYNELHVTQQPPIRLVSCPAASASTSPGIADSDGDLVLDSAECQLGSDPRNPASLPPVPVNDADNDGLPDSIETTMGSNPNAADSDGDGITDGVEFKGYNTSPILTDTDGDGCPDDAEIASVDANSAVNSLDLMIVAQKFLQAGKPALDINKDGAINSLDLQIIARNFNPVPCGLGACISLPLGLARLISDRRTSCPSQLGGATMSLKFHRTI